MDENTHNNTPNNAEDAKDGPTYEQRRREQEAAEEVHANNPDAILEDEVDESTSISGDPGDNLTDQHPSQDQTAGESGTSGRDDEDYGDEEEGQNQQ